MHDPEGRSPKAIGRRLSFVRRALGMSQREFCEHVSISPPTYNQIEKGINLPGLDKARAMKDAYGLTLDYIYDGDPSSIPPFHGESCCRPRRAGGGEKGTAGADSEGLQGKNTAN